METLKQCNDLRMFEFMLKDMLVAISETLGEPDMQYMQGAIERAEDNIRRAASRMHGAANVCYERERESRAVCCGRRVA